MKNSAFRGITVFILWTFLFAIAYSQSPLYTSNQNQYFLHGLAEAGLGNLDQDWLANTLDPTPVFSAIVKLTYRIFQSEALFYLYYALLMGVYLFSLYGIAAALFPLSSSRVAPLVFLSVEVLIHSAGLRFALARLINPDDAYLLEEGFAGQRILGPVFQPSTFGVLLALSIWLFVRRRAILAAITAALAAVVHPTYLLSAAALTLAYLLAVYWETRRLKQLFLIGLAALAIAFPILLYVWSAFGSATGEMATQARHILVYYRLPHHALVGEWFDASELFKLFMILMGMFLARRSRLLWALLVPFGVALLLTILQLLTHNDSLALLFPWRVSIFLTPIAVAIILAYPVSRLSAWRNLQSPAWQRAISSACVLLVVLSVTVGAIRFTLDLQRQKLDPERQVQSYIAAHQRRGEVYLIPVKMQDFRLVTGAPAYVEFKSIPYHAAEVLEWYRRLQLADEFYQSLDCQMLADLASQEGVTHAVLPAAPPLKCPGVIETYRDASYALYQLSPPD